MIHRFVNFLSVLSVESTIVFLVSDASTSRYAIWKGGNRTTPAEMTSTRITITSNDYLADPHLSADGDMVVYCRVGNNIAAPNRKNSIRTVAWGDTGNTEVYSETGGEFISLQPVWNPDRSKILFRAKGTGTYPTRLRSMNADGSSVTTLYTGTVSFDNQVNYPQYNYDGSKVAFMFGGSSSADLHVANSDGTGDSTIVSSSGLAGFAWAKTQNVIGYLDGSSWKTINYDGTGDTTLVTYSSGSDTWYPIMFSWTDDDSALVTLDRVSPETNWRIARIDSSSGTITRYSPERRTAQSPDTRPCVFGGRVYFVDATSSPYTKLASVNATDGSDYVLDFDGSDFGTSPVFQGFRGDTLNI